MSHSPLVSLCIVAYRQEQFIREAVQGALAQTYSPLQIIMSDDCSPDGTFREMEKLAASYKGSNKIVLNRNDPNLGLSEHVNKVLACAEGEFVVICAGDDVSLPDRVRWLAETWLRDPDDVMLVQSGFVVVDEKGIPMGVVRQAPKGREVIRVAGREKLFDYLRSLKLAASGATFSYSKRLFEVFGPMPKGVFHEDNVLLLRALLIGSMWMVGVPLIHRRAHGGNLMIQKTKHNRSGEEFDADEARRAKGAERRIELYEAFIDDLGIAHAKCLLTSSEFGEALRICEMQKERWAIERDFQKASFPQKLGYLRALRKRHSLSNSALRHYMTRLAPWPIVRASKQLLAPFRKPEVDSILRGGEDFGLWKDAAKTKGTRAPQTAIR